MPPNDAENECPKCGMKGESVNQSEYKCENGHIWLVGGPV